MRVFGKKSKEAAAKMNEGLSEEEKIVFDEEEEVVPPKSISKAGAGKPGRPPKKVNAEVAKETVVEREITLSLLNEKLNVVLNMLQEVIKTLESFK